MRQRNRNRKSKRWEVRTFQVLSEGGREKRKRGRERESTIGKI